MGNMIGAGKYMVNTPLTVVGFISMYIFGGFFMSIFNALPHLIGGDFINAFLVYFLSEALPPTSLVEVVLQAALGTVIAGTKWFIAVSSM